MSNYSFIITWTRCCRPGAVRSVGLLSGKSPESFCVVLLAQCKTVIYIISRDVAAPLLTVSMMKDLWKRCKAQGEEKAPRRKNRLTCDAPTQNPHKLRYAWEREYQRMWHSRSWRFYTLPFLSFFFSSVPSRPRVRRPWEVQQTALSRCLFYPLADHNKACYPTKQINVWCKKVMMWRWTLTPEAMGY